MSGYDPQRGHRRPRPPATGEAPVDALLAAVPVLDPAPVTPPASVTDDVASVDRSGTRSAARSLVVLGAVLVVVVLVRRARNR